MNEPANRVSEPLAEKASALGARLASGASRWRLTAVVRLSVAIAFVAVAVAAIVRAGGIQSLVQARWGLAFTALGVHLLVVFLNGVRLNLLAGAAGIEAGLARSIVFQFESQYFGFLIPGGLGGDAARAYRLRGISGSSSPALAAAGTARVMALSTTAATALAAFWLGTGHELVRARSAVLLAAATVFALASVWWVPKLASVARLSWLRSFAAALAGFRLPELAIGMLLTCAAQLAAIAVYWVAALSVGLRLPWLETLTLVVIASLASLAMIPGGGAGVREGGFYLTLVSFGASEQAAAAMAAMTLVLSVGVAGIGGLVHAFQGTSGGPLGRGKPCKTGSAP